MRRSSRPELWMRRGDSDLYLKALLEEPETDFMSYLRSFKHNLLNLSMNLSKLETLYEEFNIQRFLKDEENYPGYLNVEGTNLISEILHCCGDEFWTQLLKFEWLKRSRIQL